MNFSSWALCLGEKIILLSSTKEKTVFLSDFYWRENRRAYSLIFQQSIWIWISIILVTQNTKNPNLQNTESPTA